jgi:hypothetical protein
MNLLYQNNSLIAKLKRFLGIRDGYLICNVCKEPFVNLQRSTICYFCWCDHHEVSYW